MPSLVAESALAANLASLGRLNGDLAEKLAAAEPAADLTFAETAQGVRTAMLGNTALCSRHRPLDEADRLIESIDLVEHAVVVVFGFGLGYHVQRLAERLNKAGLIVVFEPDVGLLRTVLSGIDHSRWLRNALVVWITDPTDRGALAQKLKGTEPLLAQGVAFLEHPASRSRLAEPSRQFATMFKDFVSSAKTTLITTLMRSVETVRNLLLNVDHYALGRGIAELRDAAQGYPAVVVSAGPSLRRNVHLLAQPGVRDRCVIVAVQTTLKPLLAAGVVPHFVTALDYHEISRRFYEGLDPAAVGDIVLVADPKANPVILDAFPGPVCCCASDFLDGLFGDLRRDMGRVPPGATVSHLAVYLARFLGCNPIALIGQDLGFTDGLYYAPGTAIADVWAPELNPFNTMPMMEWQRIVRHRLHLQKTQDVRGRSIWTDAQMLTYLHQFERDFEQYAREGVEIIDATEGGVVKQHTTPLPLADVLDRHANRPLPAFPVPQPNRDPERSEAVRRRIAAVRRDVATLRETSRKTVNLIRQMLEDQHDAAKMQKHFKRIEQYRREVEQRFGAFEILNHLNQLGSFKRMKADRRLHMQGDLDPLAHQRGQLERDLDNVSWIVDAAQEMVEQLADAERLLSGERVSARPKPARRWIEVESKATAAPARIAALIPVDPQRSGLGVRRDLSASFAGKPVLQATLERLGRSEAIESIILIAPESFDIDAMIDRRAIGRRVIIERCDGSPYGVEHEAIAAARWWSDTSWRGGIAGMSVYDEVLCPGVMHPILERLGLSAALLVGPDWPLVDVTTDHGCDAVVDRYRDHPDRHNLVFTQAPPGLCGCLVSASLMQELAQRNRLSIIGGLLVYQPHAPQHDPIARDANVQIDYRVRRSLIRATFDSPRWQRRLRQAVEPIYAGGDLSSAAAVAAIEQYERRSPDPLPQHVVLELCSQRQSHGLLARDWLGIERPQLSGALAERIFAELAEAGDAVVTFGGVGDPLLHDSFDDLVRLAKRSGVRGVHLRTELLADQATLDRLLACGADVISVDLHADRAATYERMMGFDRFKEVLLNIEYLLDNRRRLTGQPGTAALAMPWVVPRLQRRLETYEDVEPFFDRWQKVLGTAVIEEPPRCGLGPNVGVAPADHLQPTETPASVLERDRRRCLTICSDGSVPRNPTDFTGGDLLGSLADSSLREIWQRAVSDA